jgi:hypothetical protein
VARGAETVREPARKDVIDVDRASRQLISLSKRENVIIPVGGAEGVVAHAIDRP